MVADSVNGKSIQEYEPLPSLLAKIRRLDGQVIAIGRLTFGDDHLPGEFSPEWLADGASTQSFPEVLAEVGENTFHLEQWRPCLDAPRGFPHFHFGKAAKSEAPIS